MAVVLVLIVFSLHFTAKVHCQECLQPGNGAELPSFQDYGGNVDTITVEHQAIIPSYKFVCNGMCGHITEWGVDVHPDGGNHQNVYTLDLQVWRPSPTVDDSTGTGCYSLVGNNRFTSISLNDGLASSLTPSPQDYILFRPGDVLGFYVEEAMVITDGVVVLTSPSSFTSDLVWYASIAPAMATSQNGDCPYSVGSNGVLNTMTRAAPVISIATMTFSCPPLPMVSTNSPLTPTPPPTLPPTDPTTSTDAAEETLPPTVQDSQRPTDTLPTTTSSSSNDNGDEVTSTTPTLTEPVNFNRTPFPVAMVAGIIALILALVIISTITFTVSLAVCRLKARKIKRATSTESMTNNQVYGVALQDMATHTEGSTYTYPAVRQTTDTTEVKRKEVFTTNIVKGGNEAHSTNIVTGGNEAYATNIVTGGNEAYANSIVPERNEAYKAVSTVTVSETADMYDYVQS